MNRMIYKYNIPLEDSFSLELPKSAAILSVDTQFDNPVLWCIFNPDDAEPTERKFVLATTGNAFDVSQPAGRSYIGTFLCMQDNFVGHLFEVRG